LVLLLLTLIGVWLFTTPYPPVKEYRLYFLEDRTDASLDWGDLSHEWSEDRVREHFFGANVRCLSDQNRGAGVTRVCVVDLRTLNGVPTMTVNFLFSETGLQRVATNIPWWSHRRGLDALVSTYGEPHAASSPEVAGEKRILGWELPGRAAVFYNRDVDLSPLLTSSTQWTGPRSCGNLPCLR
jgi:hypothetical protein